MGYEDNPWDNLTYLKSLSKDDLCIYLKGYLQACLHVREAYSRGKVDLLNAILELDDLELKESLINCVHILDRYEEMVKVREGNLLELFPEFLGQDVENLGGNR